MSYYFICQKSAFLSIISLLLYQLYLFDSIMSIIAIKTLLFHLILIISIVSLIHSEVYYINYNISKLLYQLHL
jgi:hypothetical protein